MLKNSLRLQPAQEGAWQAFATAAQAKQMGRARDAMWNSARTAPERLELANKLAKERDLGMEKTTQSMKTLYEALTPDQRKIIDQYGPRFNS